MTDEEWEGLDGLLDGWWGGDWTVQRSKAYRLAVDEFPAPEVARALTRFLESGARFRPSAAELRTAITRRGVGRPSADEAWALIDEAIRRVGCSIYSPAFDEQQQAAIDWLAERDVVLAAFAARRGLTGGPGTLGFEPVLDPEIGGAVRARIAQDWRAAVRVADERVARGLAPVNARMLRARPAGESGGGMAEVVDGLRPAPELEAGET